MGRGSKVPTSMQRLVMHEEKFTCASCAVVGFERRFPKGGYGYYTDTPSLYLSIDHIVPKSAGGTNDRTNLRVLCTACNTRKGTKNA